MSVPLLPDATAYGRAFWEEAVRHLDDARVLHVNGRLPAAIASSMKAAELGLKGVLILDNVMGWWDRLLAVHDPLTTIETTGRPVLTRHYAEINNAAPALVTNLKSLESLAPRSQATGRFDRAVAGVANPEYPFFTASLDASGNVIAALRRPEQFFDEPTSRNHYETVRSFLELLPTLYADIASWAVPLPPPL